MTVGRPPPSSAARAAGAGAADERRIAREHLAAVGAARDRDREVADRCRCPCRQRRCSPARRRARVALAGDRHPAHLFGAARGRVEPGVGVIRGTEERRQRALVTGRVGRPSQVGASEPQREPLRARRRRPARRRHDARAAASGGAMALRAVAAMPHERDGVEQPPRRAKREPKRPQPAWLERHAPARTPGAHRSNPNSRPGADGRAWCPIRRCPAERITAPTTAQLARRPHRPRGARRAIARRRSARLSGSAWPADAALRAAPWVPEHGCA